MAEPDAPDLLLTYIPHLDYDLQRHGPSSPKAHKAARSARTIYIARLQKHAAGAGLRVANLRRLRHRTGERKARSFPNRALREAGLFSTRAMLKGMSYADFFSNPAFAVVDHQVAHVYTDGPESLEKARTVLQKLEGVASVLDRGQQSALGVDHPQGGDLLLVAAEGAWFAYPWWTEKNEAPDFASHVDIHNKPGYDPCELFFGWPPISVSSDVNRIRGTHGRGGETNAIGWASSITFESNPATFLELAATTKSWLDAVG